MIMFSNDWARFPNAIVDYSTRNKSFLELASLYKKMGIRNNSFHLALLQPELRGYDPYDEMLSEDIKSKIILECQYNPWYFFREVLRFPPMASKEPIHFRANRGNIAMLWCAFIGVDFILIQPRQTGKSVTSDGLSTWVVYVGTSNSISTLLTKDAALRNQNIERLKRIRDLMPGYLNSHQPGIDADNQQELTCKLKENRYVTGVSQKTEAGANKLGRGSTTPYIHFDEPFFMENLDITAPAAMAAMGSARDEARLNKQFNSVIFTTTMGEKDTRTGEYFYGMLSGGSTWEERFFDMENAERVRRIVEKGCTGVKPIMSGVFNHRQLGYTDYWLYQRIREAGVSGDAADRDFFNRPTSGSDLSPLTRQLNNTIKDSEKDTEWVEVTDNNYVIRWYHDEQTIRYKMRHGRFIMGLDGSEAVGQDNIGVVIIDVEDLSVVGTISCNETNLIRFSQFIANMLVQYKNILFVPEKRSTGQTIVDALIIILHQNEEDPFKRIYNRIVENKETMKREYQDITTPMNRRTDQLYDRYKRYFGFNTTAESRNLLYGKVLQNAAKRGGGAVYDQQLVREILGLTVKNGRIDHRANSHDDMVIAWLLAHWCVIYGRNLDFYGIDVTQMATEVALGADKKTPEEKLEAENQRRIKRKMDEIYAELKDCDSEFTIRRLESQLIHLNSKYVSNQDDSFSIDALLQKSREEREHSAAKMTHGRREPIRLNWGR